MRNTGLCGSSCENAQDAHFKPHGTNCPSILVMKQLTQGLVKRVPCIKVQKVLSIP